LSRKPKKNLADQLAGLNLDLKDGLQPKDVPAEGVVEQTRSQTFSPPKSPQKPKKETDGKDENFAEIFEGYYGDAFHGYLPGSQENRLSREEFLALIPRSDYLPCLDFHGVKNRPNLESDIYDFIENNRNRHQVRKKHVVLIITGGKKGRRLWDEANAYLNALVENSIIYPPFTLASNPGRFYVQVR